MRLHFHNSTVHHSAVLAWLVLALACSHQPIPAEVTVGPPGHHVVSNDGTYGIVLRPTPGAMPLNEPFDLEVRVLSAASGKTLRQAELEVDAEMPAHRHGMVTQPQVIAHPGGRFVVTGFMLHMPGAWKLYFDVTRGGLTERAQVAIELR